MNTTRKVSLAVTALAMSLALAAPNQSLAGCTATCGPGNVGVSGAHNPPNKSYVSYQNGMQIQGELVDDSSSAGVTLNAGAGAQNRTMAIKPAAGKTWKDLETSTDCNDVLIDCI